MKTFKEHLKEGNVKSNANKYGVVQLVLLQVMQLKTNH